MASLADFATLDANSLQHIRKTAENPPRASVLDTIQAITKQTKDNCYKVWERLQEHFPEVRTLGQDFKFSGQGQRETPVADARGIVEIIMVLPGKAAASYRKQAANLVVRYLGGDLTMVDEIAANRLAQEQLPDEHPARIFGQTGIRKTMPSNAKKKSFS